jgi:hypothetical protein
MDFRLMEAAAQALGRSLYNEQGRDHRAIAELADHAMRVWRQTYGPLNAEQESYAAAVLVGCVTSAKRDATGRCLGLILYRLAQAVNHEVTRAGFLKRKTVVTSLEDRLAELALVAA